MRRYIHYIIFAATMMGGPVLADAPDLLPPLGMLVDAGDFVSATGMDFLDHPQSGSVNFSPNNYDIHLPGGIILPVQDVVAHNGVKRPLKDCQDLAETSTETLMAFVKFVTTDLPAKIGLTPKPVDTAEIEKAKNTLLNACNALPPDQQETFLADKPVPYQVVADIRNTAATATDIIFSAQSLDPYTGGSPLAEGSAGTTVDLGPDAGTDAVVIGAPHSFFSFGSSKPWNTPMLSASLTLLRFTDNVSQKKVLQPNSFSAAWLDRPLVDAAGKITNPACFQKSSVDPKFPAVPKSDAELLKAGCVGEGDVVAIATPHLYTNPNAALETQDKSRDLVVVSRSFLGDPKDMASKIGYLTIDRRTDKVPDDASIFQDIWQFEKSITNGTFGIPEPYGIAVVRNFDAKADNYTEGVVVGSNKEQGGRYYVYYYANGMAEPKAVVIGGTTSAGQPGFGGYGPYRVYSADVNNDRCGDILITRAKISPDGTSIVFASYFDVHLQKKEVGNCTGQFDALGTQYQVPPLDPKTPPQISSLAIADFNRDSFNDIMAADFTLYMNKTTSTHQNYVYFLEYKGGIYNTIQPPRFVVNTQDHGPDIGPIDVKADRHANLGVVIGKPMMFAPLPPPSNPCLDPKTGKLKMVCEVCRKGYDIDVDGWADMPPPTITVPIDTCVADAGGNLVPTTIDMPVNDDMFAFHNPNANCTFVAKKSGREWMHEWADCDNCSPATDGKKCTGAEDGDKAKDKCFNPGQKDSSTPPDGYGDICAPVSAPLQVCGVGGQSYDASWLTPIDSATGQTASNDADGDGVPDCVVIFGKVTFSGGLCKIFCDNCSPKYSPPGKCDANPDNCANPDQKNTNGGKFGDQCVNGGGKSSGLPQIHEDKIVYADEQPVIGYKKDLKPTATIGASSGYTAAGNGHEVTVLLNKTQLKGPPPTCTNGDLACICQQNPDLLACKCLKDPKAPECRTEPTALPTCCLDVCRGDLTAPFPRMCDYIRPYNDEIRKITGLCIDVLVPVEGTQYHISCTMPNTPALDMGNGMAYTRVFKKTGQLPKNYFKDWHKPVANDNVLSRPVLLNPVDKGPEGVEPDLSPLPTPDFDADPLLSVVPDATLNQAPGIAQIDGIMEIRTNLVDMAAATGVSKALAEPAGGSATTSKVLSLDVKGYSSPPGCQWAGPDCPRPMPNPPSARDFVNAIQAKVRETEAAGKPVTLDTINEAFDAMDVGPAFLHQKLVIPGAQGAVVIPMQNTMGGSSVEGGCGCTITATSTMHNTVLPLLMATAAAGGMLFLRRNTAKKR